MAVQKIKAFLCVGVGSVNRGDIQISSFNPGIHESDKFCGLRVLKELDVDVDVPEFDLVGMEIQSLEDSLQKERADSQVRQNILLERISKLKAIGHDAVVEG